MRKCYLVIRKMIRLSDAAPFNTPVDPVRLGIPDYFNIIKQPMDFSTILVFYLLLFYLLRMYNTP